MNWSCNRLPDDLGSSYADVFWIDLVPILIILYVGSFCIKKISISFLLFDMVCYRYCNITFDNSSNRKASLRNCLNLPCIVKIFKKMASSLFLKPQFYCYLILDSPHFSLSWGINLIKEICLVKYHMQNSFLDKKYSS